MDEAAGAGEAGGVEGEDGVAQDQGGGVEDQTDEAPSVLRPQTGGTHQVGPVKC